MLPPSCEAECNTSLAEREIECRVKLWWKILQERAWTQALLLRRWLSNLPNSTQPSRSLQVQRRSELAPERRRPGGLQEEDLQEGSASM